jgi:Zn-dependent protease/predicted transcriptional regulator
MTGAFRLFTIRGIAIEVHSSWIFVYALMTWSLAVGYFPQALPDVPASVYWLSGLVAALLLFTSVLVHELAHAFVALGEGVGVRRITLFLFGGVSHLDEDARTPGGEFRIAIAGPVSSFGIAAILWVVDTTLTAPATIAAAIVGYLVWVNLAVGIFNLIPGFPLDGGRLLRAALWRWRGDYMRATYLASRAGMGFAVALMVLGVMQMFGGSLLGGVWLILIGLFLRASADASYGEVALRDTLSALTVADVMTRDVVTVSTDASVEALAELFWTHHVTSFPVTDDGAVRGVAVVRDVNRVPRDAWARERVATVMRRLEPALTTTPGESLMRALERAAGNGLGRLAVVERDRLVGYLSLKDIVHVLALRGLSSPGGIAAPAAAAAEVPRAA